MISVAPLLCDSRPLNVLCLGAHADDIEIGCGGTLLTLLSGGRPVSVRWVVFSGDEHRAREARASAAAFLENAIDPIIELHDFTDGFFPSETGSIKAVFEQIKRGVQPDIILTHTLNDSHQDHAVIAQMTGSTFRNHLVMGYEIAKYDGDLGRPDTYIHLSETMARDKADKICQSFPTQACRSWFNPETFLSLARLRGIECNAPQGFAEAFYARKMVLSL